jgi:hypothetical protein
VSLHWEDKPVAKAEQDAAWSGFVAEFKKNSRIVSTSYACIGR